MSPGTPPDAHPEHVKAPSAASEPLAGAPYPKTSIFLKEIIDFRCRVGPSRPRISTLIETLGMPSPLSPNLFFRTCLFELCFFRTSPLPPTPRPSSAVGGLNGLAPTAADPGERNCLQRV